jgi:hypothetical protein
MPSAMEMFHNQLWRRTSGFTEPVSGQWGPMPTGYSEGAVEAEPTYGGGGGGYSSFGDIYAELTNEATPLDVREDRLADWLKEQSMSQYGEELTPEAGWSGYVGTHFSRLVERMSPDYDVLGDYQRQMSGNIEDYYDQLYAETRGHEAKLGQSGFASVGSGFFDVGSFNTGDLSRTLESERLGYRSNIYNQYDTWEAEFWNYFDYTSGSQGTTV